MSDPVSDVDKFVEHRSHRPVWTAGWTIFVAAIAFAMNTALELPQQNALAAQDKAVEAHYAQMAAKLDMVPKLLEMVVDANLKAATYFKSEITTASELSRIPAATIGESRRLISEARNGTGALISVFDSLQVGDSDADAMIAKYREDLAVMNQLNVLPDKVIVAIQTGDLRSASAFLKQMKNMQEDSDGKLTRQLTAFELRTSAFAQMADARKFEHAADLEARSVRRDDYRRHLYLLVLCAVYIGAFLSIVWHAWRRDHPSSSRDTKRETEESS